MINTNFSDLKEISDWVDRIAVEVSKLKNMITAINEGLPIKEAFDDEVFLELKQERKKCQSFSSLIVEHLLEVKYCTSDDPKNHWRKEIREYQKKLRRVTDWTNENKYDKNLIEEINNNIDKIYDDGVNEYKISVKEYPDLKEGLGYIPEKCPWDAKELVSSDIDDLLEKLPNME